MVVGGVGGAVHGSRKNLEKKRKAWAKQVAADKVKAGAVFDVMPWDAAGCLPAAQVPALLAEVMGVGVETLDADGAALVVNHARKAAGVAEEADALPREALLDSVSKYRYYLARRATIDKMFEQFDLDENGKLDRRELRKAVQSSEDNRPSRAVHNICVDLRVMKSDIEAILDEADANDDGHIDRSELLPALAAWSMLADMKIEKKKSAGCALQ
jgi:hypothetical protein